MAKLKRDDELYNLLQQKIFTVFQPDKKRGRGNDVLLSKISRYPDLVEEADYADIYFDIMFAGEKNPAKAYRRYLYGLKETAATRDIYGGTAKIGNTSKRYLGIFDLLNETPELRDKILAERERLGLPVDPNSQLAVENIFDHTLFSERTDRWITGKDGKQYLREASLEVRRNELLRQLSDLPYSDVREEVLDLREQLVDLTGGDYKVPATTFKREFVTLRENIGKTLVEKEGLVDSFQTADPNYQYRLLADRWLQQKDKRGFVQQDFLQRQLKIATGDRAILDSYKEAVQRLVQTGKIVGDIDISDKLSVRDQVKQYRRALAGNVYDIADIMPASSPAYLDLVESKKKENPTLYRETVKELSKEFGFGTQRTDKLVNRKVPLSSWQQVAADVEQYRIKKKETLFSGSTPIDDFNEAWKNTGWLRRMVGYTTVNRKDGTVARIPVGVTKFKDYYYRTGIDDNVLAFDREQELQRVLAEPFDSFNKEYKGSGEVRSLFGRVEARDKDGKPVKTKEGKTLTVPDRLTKFNGKYYRSGVDKEQLEKDFSAAIGDSKDRIATAKQKILDIRRARITQLQNDIEKRREQNLDVTKKEKLLATLTERLKELESNNYDYKGIGSFDRRVTAIRAAADELSVKADIISVDPVFNFNKLLKGVKPEERLGALEDARESLKTGVRDVQAYRQQYGNKNLVAPTWLADRSVHDQLLWYRNAGSLMSDIEKEDFVTFTKRVEREGYGSLVSQLPVGYFRKIKGNVYRSTVDSDVIAQLDKDFERFREREARVMTGPDRVEESPTKINAFGKALADQQAAAQDDMAPVRAAAESRDFSSAYKALSAQQKQLFDYNYGKPVEAGNNFYRTVYDIPDKVWAEQEKAAGFTVPRQRGGTAVVTDFNVAKEEELQKKISEDLRNRSWEAPVKEKAVVSLEESAAEVNRKIMQQAENEALAEMFAAAKKQARTVKIGSMGMLASFALFNAAISGPSEEAIAHRRKVEEERRRKMYGYL